MCCAVCLLQHFAVELSCTASQIYSFTKNYIFCGDAPTGLGCGGVIHIQLMQSEHHYQVQTTYTLLGYLDAVVQ